MHLEVTLVKTLNSSEDIEEQGFNIDRSDTMRTLKPSASIPIRSHTRDSLQEEFRYCIPNNNFDVDSSM